MTILFVSSGNKNNNHGKPGTVVYNQGKSLKALGLDVEYFLVQGKGLTGYIQETKRLKKYLKENPVDLIHAHYTLSAWTAVCARPRQPIILSLMGTDAYGEYIGVNKILFKSRYLIYLTYVIQPFVKKIICKSKHIQSFVWLKRKSRIIPNGVSLKKLDGINSHRAKMDLKTGKNHVLFLGDKNNIRKNFRVVNEAVQIIDKNTIELVNPYPIAHEKVIEYLRAVDVLVVPSLMEGSPNIVKESMACNTPVVATDVGDVRWLFGNEPGHYICSFEPEDVAQKIEMALDFAKKHGKTNGRQRILELGLDEKAIAGRLVEVYEEAIEKERK